MNDPTRRALPVYSMNLDDAVAYFGRHPGALARTQAEAGRLQSIAKAQFPRIAASIDQIWIEARTRTAAAAQAIGGGVYPGGLALAQSHAEQLRAADEVVAICTDLLALPKAEAADLAPQHGAEIANTEAALAVLESRPALAWWQGKRLVRDAARESARAAEEARALADRPRAFLHGLRQRGINVRVGKGGALVVAAGTNLAGLQSSELGFLAEIKPQAVALLRAEEAAERATNEPKVLVA